MRFVDSKYILQRHGLYSSIAWHIIVVFIFNAEIKPDSRSGAARNLFEHKLVLGFITIYFQFCHLINLFAHNTRLIDNKNVHYLIA